MDRAKMNKYKSIYKERVLPKKNIIANTQETHDADLEIYKDYSYLTERANNVLIGGVAGGKKTTD